MTLLQRFFGKFLFRAPSTSSLSIPLSPLYPRALPSPNPPFVPPEIYIIVLPRPPLNRVAERDSAGALFRVDADGRIGDLANKKIEVHSAWIPAYLPSVTTSPAHLACDARVQSSIFIRQVLL